MRFIGFIGPSYQLRSVNVDCQRCVNLYPELDEIGTGKEREVAALVSTPGLSLLTTIGDGPIRGTWVASNGQFFVVSANGLYQVDALWNATLLGNIQTFTGQVSIADNGFQLVVVDGANGYVWDFTLLTFVHISDPAFYGADVVSFQDGYLIFNKPGTNVFYITGLNAVTFSALDFASKEGNPDNIVSIIADHRNLWLFGSETIEVFYDSGAVLFPFQRIEGAFIEYGCAAALSVAKMNNTVIWLGQDKRGSGMVMMANGYMPQRISTHAVEGAIQGYSNISDATAYTYQEEGHHFYVLNFPSANTTWVFDSTTNLWHERVFTNQGQFERHRSNCHSYFNGMHVVGDYQNGNLYQMSTSFYDDNGSSITRLRASPHLTDGLTNIFYSSFQLDMETGTGLDGTGQGTNPQTVLQFSDDGGHSWSNEKWAGFGKIGKTKTRALFHRLGRSRDRVFRVKITDPVKVVLIGAEIAMTKGAS